MGFPYSEIEVLHNFCGYFRDYRSFKRELERNGKNKNSLEFDVEKDGGIILGFFV